MICNRHHKHFSHAQNEGAAQSAKPTKHGRVEPLSPTPTSQIHPQKPNMAPGGSNKDRSTSDSNRSSPNPGNAVRPNTRRNGPPTLIEEHQDIKDSLEGRKFLEKHSLLCPPGEPPTHLSLSICLHQISMMGGMPKQAINAVRSVAFLIEEMEDSNIHETLRSALDVQMTEFTSDMKTLIEDAKEKMNNNARAVEEHIAKLSVPAHPRAPTNTYTSILVNPLAHANPRVAAREGIKARQFMLEGIKSSKFSHLDNIQLKTELNKILSDLDPPAGRIRTATSSRGGGTVVEVDNDEVATWLSSLDNQRSICEKIGPNAEFRNRSYNIIAFNVPIALNPESVDHRAEICEANDLETSAITSVKWAKAVEHRSASQRTAHLIISLNSADTANRAITNGLLVCNRRCHVERTKREPTRCLKCQGWNHIAKECTEEKDTCGDCTGPHRTASCLTNEKRCISCKYDDHASWSRLCPTFLRKSDEYNNRNPDNSLQYFPTADSWTWSATFKTAPTPAPRTQLSRVQQGKMPQQTQHPRRRYDTYIPGDSYKPGGDTYTPRGDSYIPKYSDTTKTSTQGGTAGRDEAAGPSNRGQTSNDNRPPNSTTPNHA